MSSRTLRIATIRDVDVRVAPSWLLVAALLVAGYTQVFAAGDRSTAVAAVMAVAAAALFTASVLVHELAHAMEGSHRGATVEGITLFLLGGATALRDGDRRARDEFAIAAVGPWSNVVLAAVFGLVGTFAADLDLHAVADVARLLALLNVGLALFNLIPGSPLDGGRVLRAAVWAVTRNPHLATIVAAVIGLALGVALVGWSMVLLAGGRAVVAAASVGLVGAYVLYAARLELARGLLFTWLARRSAAELGPAAPQVTAADGDADGDADAETGAVLAPLAPLLAALAERSDTGSVTVVDDAGRPVGLVRRETVEALGAASSEGPAPDTVAAEPLTGLPRVADTAGADHLAGLLDREQPFVVLTHDGEDAWVSSMHLIDRAIQEQRGGHA